MLAALKLARAELSVAVTDDREIRELNQFFRHKDRPTDVLAFAMREGEQVATNARRSAEILGDVVISVETARRQAKERKRPLDDEMRMLLAHGLLHLVGYDHRDDEEERAMNGETERLCAAASGATLSAKNGPPARQRAGAATKDAAARKPARAVTTRRTRKSGSKSETSKRAARRKIAR
jgi:probable rRNA maturation factor